MRSSVYAILVVSLCDCAAKTSTITVPTLYPATLPVDFIEIPIDRCSPPIDGLYMSHAAAVDLVKGIRHIEHDATLKVLDVDRDLNLCRYELKGFKEELAKDDGNRTWALIGKLGLAGVIVGALVGGAIAIINSVRK
jgi:hypothetical protein